MPWSVEFDRSRQRRHVSKSKVAAPGVLAQGNKLEAERQHARHVSWSRRESNPPSVRVVT
jgi:hypothetical protein